MTKWPDLGYFNIAVSKNGGPLGKANFPYNLTIAFMIQDNVLFIGIKEIKSMIFIFSYYGKKLNIINVRLRSHFPFIIYYIQYLK